MSETQESIGALVAAEHSRLDSLFRRSSGPFARPRRAPPFKTHSYD